MNIRLITCLFAILFSNHLFAEAINIHVLSATIKDQNIENAEVILQKNGEQSSTGRTNTLGKVKINNTTGDESDNLLIIKKMIIPH